MYADYVFSQLEPGKPRLRRAQRPWIVPIPGTRKLSRLDENLGAAALALTPADLREIDQAAAQIRVLGARYPQKLLRMTGR